MSDVNLNEKELNELPKQTLVTIIMGLQSSVNELNSTVRILSEQLKLDNQRKYGRKTESISALQLELELGFNDAEVTSDPSAPEPTLEEVAPKKRPAGKRAEDIKKITEHKTEYIEITDEELDQKFGKGQWKRLPYQVITKLEHVPASFIAVTYNIGVYAAKKDDKIIRAEKPAELWQNSIATPSLVASIIFGKYVNGVPLYRQEQTYADNNVNISRTTMANWLIASSDRYLRYYWIKLKEKLLTYKYLHADETTFKVSKDGRETGSESFMWVYTTEDYLKPPCRIVLYDYQMTRSQEHPKNFLRGFNGTITCDGYQAYHALEKKNPDTFTVAGCWVHAKRKYAEIIKADKKEKIKGTYSEKAVKMITKIFHENGKLDPLPAEVRLEKRQEIIKPLVDEYFDWVRICQPYVDSQSGTGKAFTYSLNQEKYLRTFLNDPNVRMDNNTAERAIRPFTVGRKNWVMIDTIKGAEASAVLYSLAETAKANNIKTYDYFRYLLTELPKYIHDFETEIPESLFPWSEEFPKELFRS